MLLGEVTTPAPATTAPGATSVEALPQKPPSSASTATMVCGGRTHTMMHVCVCVCARTYTRARARARVLVAGFRLQIRSPGTRTYTYSLLSLALWLSRALSLALTGICQKRTGFRPDFVADLPARAIA